MTPLFVPHGAPTFALQPGPAGAALAARAAAMPAPRGVLMVSAHWDTEQPTLGAAVQPETLHDYWGFPDELYDIDYPAPGAPWLAEAAGRLLGAAGFAVQLDARRGLDHGAWIPLRLMYPQAEVPVALLSIQSRQDPAHHFRLGQALAPLAAQGVLIVASGNLTHNLRHYQLYRDVTPPYVGEFQEWMAQRLEQGNLAELLDYRSLAPGAREAHPRDDHLLPLYVALGAAGQGARAERLTHEVYERVIAMDAYAFHPA